MTCEDAMLLNTGDAVVAERDDGLIVEGNVVKLSTETLPGAKEPGIISIKDHETGDTTEWSPSQVELI